MRLLVFFVLLVSSVATCPAGTTPDGDGCTGKLSSVLASGSSSCGITDGSLDIWVNTALASNEIYDMTSSNLNIAGKLTVSETLQVDDGDLHMSKGNIILASGGGGYIDAQDGSVTHRIFGELRMHGANAVLRATTGVTFNDGLQTKAFKEGSVTGTEIASNAVGNAHIAANAVGASEIAANAVGSDEIAANAVGNTHIAANIDASKITSGTLNINRIPSITSAKLSYQSGIYFNNNFRITQWNYGDSEFPSGHSGIEFFKHSSMGRRLKIIGFDSVHIETAPLYANGILVISDRRIKKNIVTIPDNLALETFRGLDAKYYNYIEGQGRSTEKTLGFIAQEVAEAIPEAVIVGNGTLPDGTKVDDFHYLNKDKVFTVAYAALQEVDKNQQKHAATIATLENTIAALEARLAALEAK